MKKYRCVVSYAGAIGFEVEAENKEKAEQLAENICEELDDKDFLEHLEPQHVETNVEEIKMKKYKVIERFTVDLISEVEAENEEQARVKHLGRIGRLPVPDFWDEVDAGAGDSTYEIEEIE